MNEPDAMAEAAWMDVIRKMDETYADLLRYQVDLEQNNAELEQAQRFIASVEGAMTDVLIVCDVQGKIEQVNPALERCLGQGREHWLGKHLSQLFSPECQAQVQALASKTRHQALEDCELSLNRDGEAVPLSINCTARYDPRGRWLGMVLIGRPIGELRKAYQALNQAHAELKQAQQQLLQAEKMASLGRLVAGVAHELNNPISFVYGNVFALQSYARRLSRYLAHIHQHGCDAAQSELRDDLRIDKILKDLDPLLQGTQEGAERVRDIVEGLRHFSSSQSSAAEPFDLCATLRTALEWVIKGNRRETEVDNQLSQVLRVQGHQGQIQQVLMNLTQNAMDAMSETAQPRLEISAETQAQQAVLRMRDVGPGIPEADLLQIFEPFFTTKPIGQGTGLGLSISYGIVQEHGGQLSAYNHPQGGAVFELRLPLSATAPDN